MILCQNHIKTIDDVRRSMTHELIHAFDDCRAKVNWGNLAHHACSEVFISGVSVCSKLNHT